MAQRGVQEDGAIEEVRQNKALTEALAAQHPSTERFIDADALAFVLRQGWFANANVEALGVDVLFEIQSATFGTTQQHRRSR
jgi:hypothetical protein